MDGQKLLDIRTFCLCRDTKRASFLPDDTASMTHSASVAKPPEKQVSIHATDSTKPLSIDERRSRRDENLS
jgi:hypothetical protein